MFRFLKRSLAVVAVVVAVLSHPPATLGQSMTFTTFAGPGSPGSEDGTGSAARFYAPQGMATDGRGNVYIADSLNNTIRKITPAGAVTTLAGLAGHSGSSDGTGSAARFSYPSGVATDSSGNVFVADYDNSTIRKITPAGAVTTLAGLAKSLGSSDGTGSAARFSYPVAVATDSSGNVYAADDNNFTIRKITPAGAVTTMAGLAGVAGSADGTGSAARFDQPAGVATDSSGNVYVADANNRTIRKITPAGAVTTLAGLAGSFGSTDGTGSAARFDDPRSVATDSSGNVYVADANNFTIRKISPAGAVTTLAGLAGVAGSADGTGSAARFYIPVAVATDGSGNVYVADYSHAIRKISPAGAVTTVAGLAGNPGSADGTGGAARFDGPLGVATDSSGNVYVADSDNHTIRKITPAGVVTTLAGLAGVDGSTDGTGTTARFYNPRAVATDSSGNVYVADTFNATIRKITPAGAVSTLAGLAGYLGSSNGTGSAARFSHPSGVATDSSGNVYVADSLNNTIRKITPAGAVTTLAGLAGIAGSTDGTGSAARFDQPAGVAIDISGNVYVADYYNNTIRKISAAGAVTTLAGFAGSSGSADGMGSAARFYYPAAVATDSSGNVYAADYYNNTIRKITAAGAVTTLAGLAGSSGSADGTGSAARFKRPAGVAVNSSGNVYVTEEFSDTIRIGRTTLADVATIDLSTGLQGSTRLLDTAPQMAASWEWSVIRRPVDSVAVLSSASVRNPTFTPDVPGLFTFRLFATGPGTASLTTVDLMVQPPPRRRAVR